MDSVISLGCGMLWSISSFWFVWVHISSFWFVWVHKWSKVSLEFHLALAQNIIMNFIFFLDTFKYFRVFVLLFVKHDVLVEEYFIHIFHLFQIDFLLFSLACLFILFLVNHVAVVQMISKICWIQVLFNHRFCVYDSPAHTQILKTHCVFVVVVSAWTVKIPKGCF